MLAGDRYKCPLHQPNVAGITCASLTPGCDWALLSEKVGVGLQPSAVSPSPNQELQAVSLMQWGASHPYLSWLVSLGDFGVHPELPGGTVLPVFSPTPAHWRKYNDGLRLQS